MLNKFWALFIKFMGKEEATTTTAAAVAPAVEVKSNLTPAEEALLKAVPYHPEVAERAIALCRPMVKVKAFDALIKSVEAELYASIGATMEGVINNILIERKAKAEKVLSDWKFLSSDSDVREIVSKLANRRLEVIQTESEKQRENQFGKEIRSLERKLNYLK